MRFVVKSVSVESNALGLPMRLVTLSAVDGDEFQSDEKLPDSKGEDGKAIPRALPAPQGSLSLLLGVKAAKRFQVGDEFDLAFHERD